jgi:hypothetical protein
MVACINEEQYITYNPGFLVWDNLDDNKNKMV